MLCIFLSILFLLQVLARNFASRVSVASWVTRFCDRPRGLLRLPLRDRRWRHRAYPDRETQPVRHLPVASVPRRRSSRRRVRLQRDRRHRDAACLPEWFSLSRKKWSSVLRHWPLSSSTLDTRQLWTALIYPNVVLIAYLGQFFTVPHGTILDEHCLGLVRYSRRHHRFMFCSCILHGMPQLLHEYIVFFGPSIFPGPRLTLLKNRVYLVLHASVHVEVACFRRTAPTSCWTPSSTSRSPFTGTWLSAGLGPWPTWLIH